MAQLGTNRRVLFHLAWSLPATAAILLDTLVRSANDPGAWVWPFGLVAYALAGALILIHRPGNRVGRLFTVIGVTAGVFSGADWAALTWPEATWSLYLEVVGLPGFAVAYWGLITLLYIFPVGTTIPGWRRRLFRVFTVLTLGILPVIAVLSTESFAQGGSGRSNPFHVESAFLDQAFAMALLFLALGAVGGIASLIGRFRHSVGVEREQLKAFLAGAVFFVVIAGLALGLPDDISEPWWTYALVAAAFLSLPIAVTAGILRYRLYEIDRAISRTVSYVVVVAVLVGVFAGLIVGLQALLPAQNDLAVAASTLAVAALFNPLRRRVQLWVDKRFNRSKYDAQRELEQFGERLRHAHDLDGVSGEMLTLVNRTLQPETVSVWIQAPREMSHR